jgi:uncharacterized protein
MSAPAFRVTLDGQDLTGKIAPRLVSLTLTEARNNEVDQLDIVLDDSDGQLAIPSRGVKIALQIGWDDTGLVDKGNFTVDEVEHSGAPDLITLRARTADLIDNFRQLQERSFHDTTLGAIVAAIALEHDLKPGIAKSLSVKKIAHVDQAHESDASFLRRLGKQYDAVATVKNDTLLFAPASHSRTVSGKELPVFTIKRSSGDQHRYHSAERDSYSGVRAYWHDQKSARRRSVVAGLPGNSKRLRTTFASESDARTAAIAEWQRIQRGIFSFELLLALGAPGLIPQAPVKVTGFKPQIDDTDWVAVKATHTISKSGFTTHIEAETKTELADTSVEEHDHDPDEGITGVIAQWKDKASKKSGEELAGTRANVKKLERVYTSRSGAKHAAKLEWEKIKERREVIMENQGAG